MSNTIEFSALAAETKPAVETVPEGKFEKVCCSRCGGSGSYSYCTMYGSVCFKCGGQKQLFTKRGRKAFDLYLFHLQKPIIDVKVGDVVKLPRTKNFCEVKAIEDDKLNEGHRAVVVNGLSHGFIVANAEENRESEYQRVRVAHTKETKTKLWNLAIAYQECLTKQGAPYKKRADEAEGIKAAMSEISGQ